MGIVFSGHRGRYLKPLNQEPGRQIEYQILIAQITLEYLVFYVLLLGQVQLGSHFLVREGTT